MDPARTLYDLASLTKVIATTTAAMVLYDRGRLDLDAHVSRYLPAWASKGRSTVTVRDLLTHRYRITGRARALACGTHTGSRAPCGARHAFDFRPGSRFVYSDLGANVLGFVVEAVSHEPLNVFLAQNVYRPLGMRYTAFRPPPCCCRRWHVQKRLADRCSTTTPPCWVASPGTLVCSLRRRT